MRDGRVRDDEMEEELEVGAEVLGVASAVAVMENGWEGLTRCLERLLLW